MPVRTRVQALRTREVQVRVFRWSDGTRSLLPGDVVFPTRAEAERAWPRYRREAWATERRYQVPRAAIEYDGLTAEAVAAVRRRWTHGRALVLPPVLAAIEGDRAAASRFRQAQPKAAREIAEYLDLWLADLAEVERTALRLAADPTGGPHPGHLNTAKTYAGEPGGGFR